MQKLAVYALLLLFACACNAAPALKRGTPGKHYLPKNETDPGKDNKVQYTYNGYYSGVGWGTITAQTCTTVTFSMYGSGVFPPYPVYCGWDGVLGSTIVPGAQWTSDSNVISFAMCNVGTADQTLPSMDVYCQMNNFDY